jgi:hypothetical protein
VFDFGEEHGGWWKKSHAGQKMFYLGFFRRKMVPRIRIRGMANKRVLGKVTR